LILSKRTSNILSCFLTSHLCYQYHLRPTPPVTLERVFINIVPDIECACIPQGGVSIVPNLALFLVGFISHQIIVGYTFATSASTTCNDLPDSISTNILTDPHIRMHKYHSKCTSRTNWFDLAGTPCLVFEPEPLNTFESIEAILTLSFDEEPLEAYFWEQSAVPSPWNTYWTEAARAGGGLDINDPVFRPHWTRYTGAHSWFPCDPEDPCDCEGHNCAGAQSTVGHVAAAATTAKSLGIPLIVVVPPTPTPSEIDAYNWHWQMCLVRCDVTLNGTPSGPGIRRRSGHHHGTHRHRQRQHRVRTTDRGVCANTGGIDAGSTILPTNPRGTDGLRAPTTDRQPTTTNYRPASEAVPAPTMRPYSNRAINADSEERTGRSPEETSGPRNRRGDTTGVGRYDPGRTTIWRGSPRFEDVASQRLDSGSQSGSGHSQGSGRQRPEISRLPGLFRVRSNSVERLDCSTPNGHTTQTRQLS